MQRSSKNRLTEKELFLFPAETLFDKVGRAVCQAGCLPRKELFEAWRSPGGCDDGFAAAAWLTWLVAMV